MQKDLIEEYRDDLAVQRVVWFSQGYYAVRQDQGALYFSDLRFGRSDMWLTTDSSNFVWNYKLQMDEHRNEIIGIARLTPDFDASLNLFQQLWDRMLGQQQN
jgi:inner membrane protein